MPVMGNDYQTLQQVLLLFGGGPAPPALVVSDSGANLALLNVG